ncbi:glycosyl hydrolase [Pseudoroseomonas globiformis]|uniref:Glycosyl hydrolase n=1 Tax=Teichococcus globiformis TaxID=2307229 RepID=A0ABV7FYQ7_9PROT
MTALGVYIDNSKSHVYSFEKWLGREVDFVHAVVGFQNWTDYLNSAKWSVNSLWKDLGRDLHWSVPIISKDGNLWNAAKGDYNKYYEQVALTILNGTPGTDKIYIRTGWEANGTWFFWNAIGKEEAFKGAFREFVETFREVSDRFIFEWNVSQTSGGLDPAKIYPGDDVVDIIGMDFYYKPEFHGYDATKGFAYIRDDVYGLQWLENFAKQHGKPTSYSEWGVQGDYSAEFVKLAKAWFDSHDVVLQSYWDSNSDYPGKLSDNSDPTTGAAYKKFFAGPSTVELPDGGGAKPPVVPEPSLPTDNGLVAQPSGAWEFQSWGGKAWIGSSSNDWHQSSGGGDTMRGGKGDDTYVVSAVGDKVIEAAGQGVDTVLTWIGNYTLPEHVENLTLTGAGWSNGTGNGLANIIIGNDSPNLLNGKGGNDILTGGGGNDTFVITKGEGSDIITDFRAGSGLTDVIKLDGLAFKDFAAIKAAARQSGADTVINLGDGQSLTLRGVKVGSLASDDFALVNIKAPIVAAPARPPVAEEPTMLPNGAAPAKWLYGTIKSETLTGGGGHDGFKGNGGGDTLKGGVGDDTYVIYSATDKVIEYAGQGIDTVQTWLSSYTLPDQVENLTITGGSWTTAFGNALANRITGNGAPNVLDGRGGNDVLTGGGGSDTFVITKGLGHDTITDFEGAGRAGGDTLLLKGFGHGANLSHQGDEWSVHAADGSVTRLTIDNVTSLAAHDYVWG